MPKIPRGLTAGCIPAGARAHVPTYTETAQGCSQAAQNSPQWKHPKCSPTLRHIRYCALVPKREYSATRTHKSQYDVTRTEPPKVRKKPDMKVHTLHNSAYIKHRHKQSQGDAVRGQDYGCPWRGRVRLGVGMRGSGMRTTVFFLIWGLVYMSVSEWFTLRVQGPADHT